MKEVITFLQGLEANNNREWFNSHKDDYVAVQSRFNSFVERLIPAIAAFDDTVEGLSAKDCTYRIYRDTRFSSDKSPYKLHIGTFICPGGKKSGFAGYYFQVGPHDDGYTAGNMLAAGHYCLDAAALRVLREDIAGGGTEFSDIVGKARGFSLEEDNKLKRVPNGFPKDCACAEYLKYRSYCLDCFPGKDYMLQRDLLSALVSSFESTHPFVAYINRAIAYSRNPD